MRTLAKLASAAVVFCEIGILVCEFVIQAFLFFFLILPVGVLALQFLLPSVLRDNAYLLRHMHKHM